jgi:glutamate-1-semialdehyde aminotransferase
MVKTKKGNELWNTAKKIIPGGTQLLSKRPEMFLPNLFPPYYKKAKGIEIWDLDDNKFIDMSNMSLGTCILGYSDDDVNNTVKDAINKGTMTTLNSPEEVELSELLLKLHSWADMIRYSKTGGEAMAIAVRIARAYTKKDKIAFCGYHGWHDWYLSANLSNDKNLDGHLLSGLEPLGVPRCLKGTALPFNYNNIEELETITKNNDIGTIIVEPIRHHKPKDNFLQKIRKIADEINAVLIFDEITSGWRLNIGGVHKLYNVYPDVVVYGKAVSNGFPMAIVIGKQSIMDKAQESFISSTYWTDKIGFVATLTTINKLIKNNVPIHLNKIGNQINKVWSKLSIQHSLNIKLMNDFPPLTTFSFDYGDINQILYTLFVKEMLNFGFLVSKSVYVSYSHTKDYIEKYSEKIDDVFGFLAEGIARNNITRLLGRQPIAHKGFKRLT